MRTHLGKSPCYRTLHWIAGAALWGVAEASLFFIVPDVLITFAVMSATLIQVLDTTIALRRAGQAASALAKASEIAKEAAGLFAGLTERKNLLVVVDREDTTSLKSLRNLENVHVLVPGQLNTYDVLVSDDVVHQRFEQINAFEKQLCEQSITVDDDLPFLPNRRG